MRCVHGIYDDHDTCEYDDRERGEPDDLSRCPGRELLPAAMGGATATTAREQSTKFRRPAHAPARRTEVERRSGTVQMAAPARFERKHGSCGRARPGVRTRDITTERGSEK